jgi:hypothetical protein
MNRHPIVRAALVALVVLMAFGITPALAVKTPIITLAGPSTDVAGPRGNVAASGLDIYVTYVEGTAAKLRHSGDSGATFGAPITLSDPSATAVAGVSIAAVSANAYATWIETGSDGLLRGMYRRSTNHGATWSPATAMTDGEHPPSEARVFASEARVWLGYVFPTRKLFVVLRSRDFGASFPGASNIGRSVGGDISIAFGIHVVYAAWVTPAGTVRVARSTNGGISWDGRTTLGLATAGHPYSQPWLTASGRGATIATHRRGNPDTIVIRRTTDRGLTWGPARRMSPLNLTADSPVVRRTAGRWFLAFSTCNPFDCEFEALVYRTSADGVTWSGRFPLQSATQGRGLVDATGIAATGDGTTWFGWRTNSVEDISVSVRGVK